MPQSRTGFPEVNLACRVGDEHKEFFCALQHYHLQHLPSRDMLCLSELLCRERLGVGQHRIGDLVLRQQFFHRPHDGHGYLLTGLSLSGGRLGCQGSYRLVSAQATLQVETPLGCVRASPVREPLSSPC